MKRDFYSQDLLLNSEFKPPPDALGHGELADALLGKLRLLEAGAIVAIQGGWGTGKTDVMVRLAHAENQRIRNSEADPAQEGVIWVNPWQYATPDLLTPVAVSLAQRSPKTDVEGAFKSLVSAGLNFGQRATGAVLTASGDAVIGPTLLSAPIADKIWEAFSESRGQRGYELDPVAGMGRAFREMVEAALPEDVREAGGRLIICIDDLDRCLPERQVAWIEALGFLAASGAPCTILVAMDPTLAVKSVAHRYQISQFDAQRFLDKLFDFRLNLPNRDAHAIRGYVGSLLAEEYLTETSTESVEALILRAFNVQREHVEWTIAQVTDFPYVNNPRAIRRLLTRLALFAASTDGTLRLGDSRSLIASIGWLLITDSYPQIRHAFHKHENPANFIKFLRNAFTNSGNQTAGRLNIGFDLPEYDKRTAFIAEVINLGLKDQQGTVQDNNAGAYAKAVGDLEASLRKAGM